MKRTLKTKFLGKDVEIPIADEDGDLVFATWDDEPFEIKLPYGFVWSIDFEVDDRAMENNRSIIKNEYGDIVSENVYRYIEPDDPIDDFEELIKETFDNFNDDLTKKLEEAKRTIPLYEKLLEETQK